MRKELINSGFIFIPNFKPEVTTELIAKETGDVIKLGDVPIVQSIIPHKKEDASPNVYSGNYGLEEFPLHTDLAHWYSQLHKMCLHQIKNLSHRAYEKYSVL